MTKMVTGCLRIKGYLYLLVTKNIWRRQRRRTSKKYFYKHLHQFWTFFWHLSKKNPKLCSSGLETGCKPVLFFSGNKTLHYGTMMPPPPIAEIGPTRCIELVKLKGFKTLNIKQECSVLKSDQILL